MSEKIPRHVFEAKPSEFDYILGNIPYGPHQPGTVRKFIYFAGKQFGFLWAFSYHPLKD